MLERVKREEEEENRLQAEKASDARLVAEVILKLKKILLFIFKPHFRKRSNFFDSN